MKSMPTKATFAPCSRTAVGEERELEAARPAPRGPLVDDDRVSLQRRQAGREVGGALARERVGVGGVALQRGRRRAAVVDEGVGAAAFGRRRDAHGRLLRALVGAAAGEANGERGGDEDRERSGSHDDPQDGESRSAAGGLLGHICPYGQGSGEAQQAQPGSRLSPRAARRPRSAAVRRRPVRRSPRRGRRRPRRSARRRAPSAAAPARATAVPRRSAPRSRGRA